MPIWVDADACPKVVHDILLRAAERTQTTITMVANRWLATPTSSLVRKVQVAQGFDIADAYIVQELQTGDLVITADIPLAAKVIAKGGMALNPRGELYNQENIGHLLAIRNFHSDLRDAGVSLGGPAKLTSKDIQTFANRLDTWLAQSFNR